MPTRDLTPDATADDEGVDRVVLLVEHRQNRRVLAEYLRESYAVTDELPADPATVGCIVVDEGGLERHRAAIESLVDRSDPVVLPVLLVARDQTRLPERAWSLADEVVTTPIDRAVFANRLAMLLRTRAQSLAIKRDKERSERRFRRLFRTAPDPVLIVDGDGVIVDANRAFVDLVDSSHDAVVGENVLDVGFEPSETIERILLRVDDGETPSDRTVNFVDRGGETHVSELNAEVLSHLGEATQRIGMFRDVTDREATRETLERKIDRLDAFSSIVSHDLRNPLTVAKGQLTLVEDDCESPAIEEVADALDRMDELIEQLLDVARTGTVVTDPTVLDLGAVARSAVAIVEEDVAIEVPTDVRIRGEETQVERIFENLFRNAREHASPPVTVRVGALEDGFFVEDDGPGIPPDDRDQVLTMGYTTETSGSGLGLSIVRDVAAAHGWSIDITEGSEGGARFEFHDVEVVE